MRREKEREFCRRKGKEKGEKRRGSLKGTIIRNEARGERKCSDVIKAFRLMMGRGRGSPKREKDS